MLWFVTRHAITPRLRTDGCTVSKGMILRSLCSGFRKSELVGNQTSPQFENDLIEIVRRVVGQYHVLAPDVPVDLIGPSTLRLRIDGLSVERALMNLLENAARSSPQGVPVEIAVELGKFPRLSVTDHGPGLAPGDGPVVFQRYFRGREIEESETDLADRAASFAFVKQVADAHGRFDVQSPLRGKNHGTRFTLTFTGGDVE